MTSGIFRKRFIVVCICVALLALLGAKTLAKKATSRDLGGPERYLTHVSTDKPIYRLGELVYVRAVVLKADDHTPLPADQNLFMMIQIKGPKGDIVATGHVNTEYSVGGFAWQIPADTAGGQYTVQINYPAEGFAPAERKFDIRAYRVPRLRTQIVFLRDGYGPGDQVQASLHVERAEGGIPAGAKVSVTARVDGEEIDAGRTTVDEAGNCTASFKLPEQIERGEGTLVMVIEDGGVVETAAKTIPILLNTVDLQIYPESGDLVADLPTRVYLEARTPARKPADIAGIVVDAAGHTVIAFRTEHEGRGRFEFTPRKGGQYTLKITEPAGIDATYTLPEVNNSGAVIRPFEDQAPAGDALRLRIGGTNVGPLTVTLAKREREIGLVKIDPKPGQLSEVVFTPPSTADGVLIATVWDANGKPLAERLLYRQPMQQLHVKVHLEDKPYIPGQKVNLIIETSDGQGQPVAAVVGLTVTDDSVLEMIEKREQAPRLPVMVFLEPEVRELADAHVYLDPDDPKAPLALDLLLGTQGWRRFAFYDASKFLTEFGDQARRVLAMRTPSYKLDRRMRALNMIGGAVQQEEGLIERDAVAEQMVFAMAEPAAMPDRDMPAAEPAPLAPAPPRERPIPLQDRPADERVAPPDFVAVRVYAHQARPDRKPGERIDFTETLYWNAGVKTAETTGKAEVSFALSDSITTFRVFADGFNAHGALGQATSAIEAVEPFYIEPKLPLEVTAGDVIELPVALINGTDDELQAKVTIKTHERITITGFDTITLPPHGRGRGIVNLQIGDISGPIDLTITASAGAYSDSVIRKLEVKPAGFPIETAFGGMLTANSSIEHTIVIPADVVLASLTAGAVVYPTPLANLTEALERLIREPTGCFEQTSSTLYPIVMAIHYFETHAGISPALIERSKAMLDKGYARLISYECQNKGYEWFGADPGHEALTAYGLLQFNDMAAIYPVDAAMVQRTRNWLLARRDGQGGFTLDAKALDSFGRAPRETTYAYIVWALLESGAQGFDKEIAMVQQMASESQDSYLVALAANIALLANDSLKAKTLMDRLAAKQTKEGYVDGAVTSITRSGGDALRIETTALATLAWLKEPAYAATVERSMHWLAERCKAGRFGSTQSTILALRAIVEYDKVRGKPKTPGRVQILVDGHPVGESIAFDANTREALKLPDIGKHLTAGEHTIALKMIDGSDMPYAITVNYHAVTPSSSPECPLTLTVALTDSQIKEGSGIEANVTVTNRTGDGLPMPLAIVGIPGGLEPRHDQLKELVKAERIAAYEVRGRDVVLYWREMKPNQRIELPLSLVAAVPGTYTAPAGRTYLYYTDEHKHWLGGPEITIVPRNP
ncbi:MAG: A-macroglobulin complement component [Phycisphaerales bacterium]|nr:A-macroglobulin complement component [Phycisphaerales bacterium]